MKLSKIKLGIIVSRFNHEVTERLLNGAKERLAQLQITETSVEVVTVPGAVEIPFMAQEMAMTKQYEAIICLGAVIRGETDHYDYVCQQVSHGCQQVALQHHLPVIFGVLTTQDEALALARAGGAHGNKGRDAVDAAIEMLEVLYHYRSKNPMSVEVV